MVHCMKLKMHPNVQTQCFGFAHIGFLIEKWVSIILLCPQCYVLVLLFKKIIQEDRTINTHSHFKK
jgi:hypothetical protein